MLPLACEAQYGRRAGIQQIWENIASAHCQLDIPGKTADDVPEYERQFKAIPGVSEVVLVDRPTSCGMRSVLIVRYENQADKLAINNAVATIVGIIKGRRLLTSIQVYNGEE